MHPQYSLARRRLFEFGCLVSLVVCVRAFDKTVTIACPCTLSGAWAAPGLDMRRGWELWRDKVNAQGGIHISGLAYEVVLVVVDVKSDSAVTAAVVKDFLAGAYGHIDFMFHPYSSTLAPVVAELTEAVGMPTISGHASAGEVYETAEGERRFQYLFGLSNSASSNFEPMVRLSKIVQAKSLAIVYEDTAFTRSMMEGTVQVANEILLDVVDVVKVSGTAENMTAEMSAVVERFRSHKPDVIIGCTYQAGCESFLTLSRQLGLSAKALGLSVCVGSHTAVETLQDTMRWVSGPLQWDYRIKGEEYLEKSKSRVNMFVPTNASLTSPLMFYNEYLSIYNVPPTAQAASATASGLALQAAIIAADSIDREAVRDSLAGLWETSFFGRLAFNSYGRNDRRSMLLLQYDKDLVPQIVSPLFAATQSLVYPMPDWSSLQRNKQCPLGTAAEKDECTPCVPGTFANESGLLSCYPCEPGEFSRLSGASACTDCPPGSYTTKHASTKCDLCPSGSFSSEYHTTQCELCSPGEFVSEMGKSACAPCGQGKFCDHSGCVNCSLCPAGSMQPNLVATSCEICPPGYSQPRRGSDGCEICGHGYYSEAEGTQTCSECPPNSYNYQLVHKLADTNNTHAALHTSLDDCLCLEGYFKNPTTSQCEPCPNGGACCACPEMSLWDELQSLDLHDAPCTACLSGAAPIPKPGYVLSKMGSVHASERPPNVVGDFIVKCHSRNACLGGRESTCGAGYEGQRCGECSVGFYWIGGGCAPCSSTTTLLFAVFVVIVPAVIMFLIFVATLGIRISSLIIFVNYAQMLALLRYLDIEWPPFLLSVLDSASSLNVNLNAFGPECVSLTNAGYWRVWLLWVLFPVLFGFAMLGFFVASKIVQRMFFSKKIDLTFTIGWRRFAYADNTERVDVCINAYLMFVSGIYTMLISRSLEIFLCNPEADGTYSMLLRPDINCYTPEWYQYQWFGAVMSVIYGLGAPAFLAMWLRRNKIRLTEDPRFRRRYGCFFKGYQSQMYWWDSVSMMRKSLLLMATVLLKSSAGYQAFFGLSVIFGDLMIKVVARPYRINSVNRCQVLLDVCLFLTFLSGVFFTHNMFEFSTTKHAPTQVMVYVVFAILMIGFLGGIISVGLELRIHIAMYRQTVASLQQELEDEEKAKKEQIRRLSWLRPGIVPSTADEQDQDLVPLRAAIPSAILAVAARRKKRLSLVDLDRALTRSTTPLARSPASSSLLSAQTTPGSSASALLSAQTTPTTSSAALLSAQNTPTTAPSGDPPVARHANLPPLPEPAQLPQASPTNQIIPFSTGLAPHD